MPPPRLLVLLLLFGWRIMSMHVRSLEDHRPSHPYNDRKRWEGPGGVAKSAV